MKRSDPSMKADLDDSVGITAGPQHGLALVDRVAGRLFHEHVRPGFHRGNRLQRVPVVRGGDDHDLRLLAFEEFPVVLVGLGTIPAQVIHLVGSEFESVGVDIGEGNDLDPAAGHGLLEDVFAPPTGPNEGGPIFADGIRGSDKGRGGESGTGQGGAPDELASGKRHGRVDGIVGHGFHRFSRISEG